MDAGQFSSSQALVSCLKVSNDTCFSLADMRFPIKQQIES
jgi:hypothetical protein